MIKKLAFHTFHTSLSWIWQVRPLCSLSSFFFFFQTEAAEWAFSHFANSSLTLSLYFPSPSQFFARRRWRAKKWREWGTQGDKLATPKMQRVKVVADWSHNRNFKGHSSSDISSNLIYFTNPKTFALPFTGSCANFMLWVIVKIAHGWD